MNHKERLEENRRGWNQIADDWFGSTSLPKYAPLMAFEDDLNLFGHVEGLKVLDIGCGSGHSLKYLGDQGAGELWGLDLSSSQLKNARRYLGENNYKAQLFESPMEENPGIPENYFDVVYSIYAFGWTVDLEHTIQMVSKYLKSGGFFIMSWDHPILNCLDVMDDRLVIDRSYHPHTICSMSKNDEKMTFTKWKMSSYINAFAKAGMYVEHLIEEVPEDLMNKDHGDLHKYYSKDKAKLLPLSMIIKARKL